MKITPDTASSKSKYRLIGVLIVACAVLAVVVFARFNFRTTDLEKSKQAIAGGNIESAILFLQAHLEQHPEDSQTQFHLGFLLKATDPDLALAEFAKIPEESPRYLESMRQIAVMCLLSARYADAEFALRILETKQPEDFGVQLSLAESLFHQKQFKQALTYANRVTQLDSGRVDSFLLLADILEGLNRNQDMIPPLQKAIKLDPESYTAHLDLAFAFTESGMLAEAAREANWCLERNPDEGFAHFVLASVARDEGKFDVARKEIDKALKLNPKEIDCQLLVADILIFERKPEEAYEILKPYYAQQKTTFRYLGSLARAAAATGRTLEAQKLFKQAALAEAESKRQSRINRSEE